MKVELIENYQIELIPENIQDKVWLAIFVKEADEIASKCIELEYYRKTDRGEENGYADPEKVGDPDGIYFEEITRLVVHNMEI